jgi:hypothetical protein
VNVNGCWYNTQNRPELGLFHGWKFEGECLAGDCLELCSTRSPIHGDYDQDRVYQAVTNIIQMLPLSCRRGQPRS